MSVPDHGPTSGAYAPADLTQRVLDARVSTAELMEQRLAATQAGDMMFEPRTGTELLMFWCRGIPCALPLTALREVLRETPAVVYLPFSPAWMLGLFPLRNELVGLVDPAPLLLGTAAATMPGQQANRADPSASYAGLPGTGPATTALVVGTQDRCLAWIVDTVGEIATAPDDAIRAGTASHGMVEAILPRYIAGTYQDPAAERECVVLHAETLLEDLLIALEEGGDAPHG